MHALDTWLNQATRRLAKASAAQVRTEIQEHYHAAREAAIESGATSDEADRLALAALGDPKIANCQYRQVLLTSAEAKMLRDLNWEAVAICSRPWLKWLLRAAPLAALLTATALFITNRDAIAKDVLLVAIGMSPLLAAPLLPIYTPARSRIFRVVKWLAITTSLILVWGPEAVKWSWLLISCLWPVVWTEWTRASIRRKLPVTAWPRHLYL